MSDKPSKFSYDLALALNKAALPVFDRKESFSDREIIEGFGLAIGAYMGSSMVAAPAMIDIPTALKVYLDILRASAEAEAVSFIESRESKAPGSQAVH